MDWFVVKNLHAYYGHVKILQDINFSIKEGEFILILGANNAGKTTLLRAISGIVKTKGEVIFQGEKINKKSINEIARFGIAYVPQREGIFTGLTVQENLRLGSFASGKKITTDGWDFIFDIFPVLKNKLHTSAILLSGGEQHMLAIARALIQKPKLLLLDEPSDGLGPKVIKQIFEIMKTMNEKLGLTIILVEQNAHLAISYVNYVHLLASGSIAASGDPATIQAHDTVLKIYLGL